MASSSCVVARLLKRAPPLFPLLGSSSLTQLQVSLSPTPAPSANSNSLPPIRQPIFPAFPLFSHLHPTSLPIREHADPVLRADSVKKKRKRKMNKHKLRKLRKLLRLRT